MSDLFIKAGWGLLSKLLTEAFLGRALVYSLSQISQSTSNKLDDKICQAVADAFDVK